MNTLLSVLLPAVFFSGLFASPLRAQSHTDSLYAAAQLLPNDSTKVLKIIAIASTINRSSPAVALRYAEEALALSEKIAFEPGKTKAYCLMADVALNTGQPEEALDYYTEALRICNRHALRPHKAEVLRGMSNYFRAAGEEETARNYVNQSIALSRELGDSLSVAKGLNNLGTVSASKDKLACYLHAAAIMEARPTIQTEAAEANLLVLIYNNLSTQHMLREDPETALVYSGKAAEVNKTFDNNFNNILIYTQMASIYSFQEKYQLALRYSMKSLELAKKTDLRNMNMANIHEQLIEIYTNLKDYQSALPHAREALRLYQSMEHSTATADALYRVAEILFNTKEYSQALSQASDALNMARMYELFPLMVSCENLSGEILVEQGNDAQALERLLRAATLIDQHNLPKADFAPVYGNLAKLYKRLGQPEKAKEMQDLHDSLPSSSNTN